MSSLVDGYKICGIGSYEICLPVGRFQADTNAKLNEMLQVVNNFFNYLLVLSVKSPETQVQTIDLYY